MFLINIKLIYIIFNGFLVNGITLNETVGFLYSIKLSIFTYFQIELVTLNFNLWCITVLSTCSLLWFWLNFEKTLWFTKNFYFLYFIIVIGFLILSVMGCILFMQIIHYDFIDKAYWSIIDSNFYRRTWENGSEYLEQLILRIPNVALCYNNNNNYNSSDINALINELVNAGYNAGWWGGDNSGGDDTNKNGDNKDKELQDTKDVKILETKIENERNEDEDEGEDEDLETKRFWVDLGVFVVVTSCLYLTLHYFHW